MIAQSTLRFDSSTCVLTETDDALLKDVLDDQSEIVANGDTQQPHACTMHLPFGLPLDLDHTTSQNYVQLTGDMHLLTLLPYDVTLGQTLAALREDANISFRARLAIVQELDADEDGAERATSQNDSGPLPVRVIATPTDDSTRGECIPLTDYITIDEDVSDVTNRIVELMSWDDTDLAAHSVEQVERFGRITSINMPQTPTNVAELNGAISAPVDFVKRALVIAIVVALIAVAYKIAN